MVASYAGINIAAVSSVPVADIWPVMLVVTGLFFVFRPGRLPSPLPNSRPG